MTKMSLASIAHALDDLLDSQMVGQARITAQLVSAAEAAGIAPEKTMQRLVRVRKRTTLDELWVTDETGETCYTTACNKDGSPVQFQFLEDPAVQPQASHFHSLLTVQPSENAVVVQAAQVREIDYGVFKYVGVNGVDKCRIVQVGSALAFEEQGLLQDSYASPVMTAVLAAFGEADLLRNAFTDRLEETRAVMEDILGAQMVIQATLAVMFLELAEQAGWSTAEIESQLQRIVENSSIGKVQSATLSGEVIYSSHDDGFVGGGLPFNDDLAPIQYGGAYHIVRPAKERAGDGVPVKSVTAVSEAWPRVVQVDVRLEDRQLVSPRFGLTS